jgi:hypothetical protein
METHIRYIYSREIGIFLGRIELDCIASLYFELGKESAYFSEELRLLKFHSSFLRMDAPSSVGVALTTKDRLKALNRFEKYKEFKPLAEYEVVFTVVKSRERIAWYHQYR